MTKLGKIGSNKPNQPIIKKTIAPKIRSTIIETITKSKIKGPDMFNLVEQFLVQEIGEDTAVIKSWDNAASNRHSSLRHKKSSTIHFLDDVIAFSKEYDSHLRHLREVLEAFRKQENFPRI